MAILYPINPQTKTFHSPFTHTTVSVQKCSVPSTEPSKGPSFSLNLKCTHAHTYIHTHTLLPHFCDYLTAQKTACLPPCYTIRSLRHETVGVSTELLSFLSSKTNPYSKSLCRILQSKPFHLILAIFPPEEGGVCFQELGSGTRFSLLLLYLSFYYFTNTSKHNWS